jgi:hypothetical protein
MILIDSGAYTARHQGVEIDLDAYIAFLKRNAAQINEYINLDTIPDGHKTEEAAAAKSYANQQAMKAAGLKPIPVFHQDESFRWLGRMLADDEKYIAVAPATKGYHAMGWLDDVFHIISDSKGHPLVKVHGLGITTPILLRRYKWASVDSATWLKQSGFGQIPIPMIYRNGTPDYSFGHDTFAMTDRARGRQCRHIDDADDFDFERIERCLNDGVGIDIAEARYGFEFRCKVWIAYFKALEAYLGFPIYFVTNGFHYELLTDCHRLLSYALLKDQTDECIANIIEGRLPRATKPRTIRWRRNMKNQAAFDDYLRLRIRQRLRGYEARVGD